MRSTIIKWRFDCLAKQLKAKASARCFLLSSSRSIRGHFQNTLGKSNATWFTANDLAINDLLRNYLRFISSRSRVMSPAIIGSVILMRENKEQRVMSLKYCNESHIFFCFFYSSNVNEVKRKAPPLTGAGDDDEENNSLMCNELMWCEMKLKSKQRSVLPTNTLTRKLNN